MSHAKTEDQWIILDRLADLILRGVDGCIVDIGIGLSTIILSRYSIKFKRQHYSCDKSRKVIDYYIPKGGIHPDHTVTCCDALEFTKSFKARPALVFIDGFHYYDDVIIQVDYFLQRMRFGSVLFLHDTCPPSRLVRLDGAKCGNVYRARLDLESRKDVCTFTWPYKFQAQGCGLTMVMKWSVI